jgi:hypothetical protein
MRTMKGTSRGVCTPSVMVVRAMFAGYARCASGSGVSRSSTGNGHATYVPPVVR